MHCLSSVSFVIYSLRRTLRHDFPWPILVIPNLKILNRSDFCDPKTTCSRMHSLQYANNAFLRVCSWVQISRVCAVCTRWHVTCLMVGTTPDTALIHDNHALAHCISHSPNAAVLYVLILDDKVETFGGIEWFYCMILSWLVLQDTQCIHCLNTHYNEIYDQYGIIY